VIGGLVVSTAVSLVVLPSLVRLTSASAPATRPHTG
jgi:Cu/Ag efflux pump CusA